MTERCSVTPGCAGQIVDGFCDLCGMQPVMKPRAGAPEPFREPSDAHQESQASASSASKRTGSTQLSGASARGSRRSSSRTSASSSRRLGLGLVTVPDIPKADPLKNLMAEAKVPENKRYCSGTKSDGTPCEAPLTKEKCTACGLSYDFTGTPRSGCKKCGGKCEIVSREKGFCNLCGTPYDFRPKLKTGDTLAGEYEVAGCLAFGGMGWIYLAKDVTLNRYVVLKGLVNSSDPNLAKAAVAERQFLAEVKQPNIVDVYTCVSDSREIDGKTETHAYTVMEFVGGATLKSIRKERGPLPAAEVLAYMHPVLLAFGYLHANGLLYNDFKPDNVMLEEGDIKIIDLGGVCRMAQPDGDIYSTVGYAAPELAQSGPSPSSDLYTIGRTIAVLATEFAGFQSSYRHKLRGDDETPAYQKYDSLLRLLKKATHDDPNMRFQSADEMAEQVVGVLREVVASDTGVSRPAESKLFSPDTLGLRSLDERGVDVLDIDSFPVLKMNPTDPAIGFILGSLYGSQIAGDPHRQAALLSEAVKRFPDSLEAMLAMARNCVRMGAYEEGEKYLAKVEAVDAYDWRVIWYRGLALVGQNLPLEALKAFDNCYSEAPGELSVQLAIAIAAELGGNLGLAIKHYEDVSRTDPSYATALFGLGRCLANLGKREQAAGAYARVPQTSNLYGEAQKAIARTLIADKPAAPGAPLLLKASETIEALKLEGEERINLTRMILSTALDLITSRQLRPEPGVKLFGHGLEDKAIRLGLEGAYRDLARIANDETTRITLVDLANRVRPTTLL
jgi:serine/threonine-protein kinase PknG